MGLLMEGYRCEPSAGARRSDALSSLSGSVLTQSLVRRDRACTLCFLRARLCGNSNVSIAAVGASVTAGSGLSSTLQAWPAVAARTLGSIWPKANVTMYNMAVPATSAGFAALCLNSLLPRPGRRSVDLLVIEYSHTTEHAYHMRMLINVARWQGIAVLILDYFHPVNARAWGDCREKRHYQNCNVSELALPPRPHRFLGLYNELQVPVVSSHVLHTPTGATKFSALYGAVTADGRHATLAAHDRMGILVAHAIVESVTSAAGGSGYAPMVGASSLMRQQEAPRRSHHEGPKGEHSHNEGVNEGPEEEHSFCHRNDALLAHVLPRCSFSVAITLMPSCFSVASSYCSVLSVVSSRAAQVFSVQRFQCFLGASGDSFVKPLYTERSACASQDFWMVVR